MTGQATSKDASKHEALEGMEYQPTVNQTGHHPMPASHNDDKDQAAVRQHEEDRRRSHGTARSAPDRDIDQGAS